MAYLNWIAEHPLITIFCLAIVCATITDISIAIINAVSK